MTLSVMDELDFNSGTYQCVKCEKLETDLKTSKSEVADLRNLVTVMRSQTAKTAALLQKFESNKKALLLQKQKIETLEKQNEALKAEAKTVNRQLNKLLDSSEHRNSRQKDEEIEKQRNNIISQKTVIKQFEAQFKNMEKEMEQHKSARKESEKTCKDLQTKISKLNSRITELKDKKSDNSGDLTETISKLKQEIGVLKRENTRLKNARDENANKLAEKKKNDISEKLAAFTYNKGNIESTIEKTIERTLQKNLKGLLETVTSPVKGAGGGMFRSPPPRGRRKTKSTETGRISSVSPSGASPLKKKRGRAKKQPPKPETSSDADSDLESISRPEKKVKRPVNRRQSLPKKTNKAPPKLKQKLDENLSNSSSDDDVDLVGQLEESFRVQAVTKCERDGVLVCDPLPSTSNALNLFDQVQDHETPEPPKPSTSALKSSVKESPKPPRKLPTVLNVDSIFRVMISSPELSPMKTRPELESSVVVKSEESLETVPSPSGPPIPAPTTSEESTNLSPSEPATATSLKSSPKKELSNPVNSSEPPPPINSDTTSVDATISPSFQPISIKNEMNKTKSEPNDNVITLKPRSSKEVRAAPIVSTLGELLSPSKVRPDSTPSPATPTSDVEIVGVVSVEREEPSVSASDSQTEDDVPEISVTAASESVTEPKPAYLESQSTSLTITSKKADFKPLAFVPTTVQVQTPQVLKDSVKPKSRIPPISMSFVRPKLSSSILQESSPPVVDAVNKSPVSIPVVPSTPTTPSPTFNMNKTSVNDPKVPAVEVASKSMPSSEDAKSSELTHYHESAKQPHTDPTHTESPVKETSTAPKKIKTERSPSRRQSEVNLTLSGDSLVTPTTPTEIVVSEDVMVCAFEMDVGANGTSSYSDQDTQSDSAADLDCSETSKQSSKSVKQFERPATRSRKSNSASFVAPTRVSTRRSASQEEQPVIFTKCLRNRRVSFTEDFIEAPKRRKSARTSSVSDVSDSNESPAPRRSLRNRASTSPSPVKSQKPKQTTKKKVPDLLTPSDFDIEDNPLGSVDRNFMVPQDLQDLKKSMEEAQLQETTMKDSKSAMSSEQENAESSACDQATDNDVMTESLATHVLPASSSTTPDSNMLNTVIPDSPANPSCSKQNNGAKAVEHKEQRVELTQQSVEQKEDSGTQDAREDTGASASNTKTSEETIKPSAETRKFSTEKTSITKTPITPSPKTLPPPLFDWHAAKSLDMDLTPVIGKLPDNNKTVLPDKTNAAGNSDESLVEEDRSLMIADPSVVSHVTAETSLVDQASEDVTLDEGTASTFNPDTDPLSRINVTTPPNRVKAAVPPASQWFTSPHVTQAEFTHVTRTSLKLADPVSESSDLEIASCETENRKRKKKSRPDHNVSLSQIFDIFIPNKTLSPLLFSNEHLVMRNSYGECTGTRTGTGTGTPSSTTPLVSVDVSVLDNLRKKATVPTLSIDDEPLYHATHEDYSHLHPHTTTKHLVQMFRKNLCTSAPNLPYIIETILYNHKNKSLQNVHYRFISVIKNEISIRDTTPANIPVPPIDVLVEFFFTLFTKLTQTGYTYFHKAWISELLKIMFAQIQSKQKKLTKSYISILSFVTKLSMKCADLKYLRAFVINMISEMSFKFVIELINTCFGSYSVFLLIGEQHLFLNKDKNSIRDVNCLYLAGLEFYLRYTQLKFTPIEQLSYIHQFAVEHHLINAALEAVAVKEEVEIGKCYRNLKDQGVLCLKLMVKSQGWSWFTATILPAIFDKLSTTTEFGICRLTELITTLVAAEIVSYRAGQDIQMLKDKLLPALIGLLWTAPSVEMKFSYARCLIQLSPLDSTFVASSLKNWSSSAPPTIKQHHLFSELENMIDLIENRQDGSKKARKF